MKLRHCKNIAIIIFRTGSRQNLSFFIKLTVFLDKASLFLNNILSILTDKMGSHDLKAINNLLKMLNFGPNSLSLASHAKKLTIYIF